MPAVPEEDLAGRPDERRAAHRQCWYADPDHRPTHSRCPAACNGAVTHAERLADGLQRFYCEAHAFWRASEVGGDHIRPLRPGERTSEQDAHATSGEHHHA